ncbi:hypothetical protein [Pseudomonas fluorescens]|uniref:Uncharacterized protein n=1 Tax=Pseudomonas fluorescens TaxID=294 RepID=A0A0F4TM97_PSEFL|nr:hypothetical protein [Pseudomonas fluorescens]KJZ45558.1 hypothetical protein VC34_08465 [Pseudomonas fluorescens]
MNSDLNTILDTVLALDIDSEVSDLTAFSDGIAAFCRDNKIPFTTGTVSNTKSYLIVDSNETEPFLEWLTKNPPSFVVIEFRQGTTNETEGMILDFMIDYAEKQNRLDNIKKLQAEVSGKKIEFVTHAIFGNPSLIVEHVTSSKLRMLCSIFEPEDDNSFDDDSFESAYKTDEQITEYANKLAIEENFYLAKNINDRVNLAIKVFGGEFLSFDLNRIARESATIYKMEILPTKILDMVAQGKDFKEISILLGESQNKVKQIIAVSQSKDVAES